MEQSFQNFKLSREQEKILERVLEILPELRALPDVWASKDEANKWHVQLGFAQENGEAPSLASAVYIGLQKTQAHLGFQADTGDLTGYSITYPDWASEEKPSPEIALRRANTFIESIMGANAVQYTGWHHGSLSCLDKEGNMIDRNVISVKYTTLIHGIPFPERLIQVSVDATGEVIHFTKDYYCEIRRWEALDLSLFPHPDKAVITLSEAERILKKNIVMELVYMITTFVEPGQGKLVYMVRDALPIIDVITGENPWWFLDTIETEPKRISINGQGRELIATDQKSAEELLRRCFGVDLEGLNLDRVETYNGNLCSYYWSGDKEKEQYADNGSRREFSLATKPDSGEMISFCAPTSENNERKEVISPDEALVTALSLMEKILPVGEHEMILTMSSYALAKDPEWLNMECVDRRYYSSNLISFYFNYTHLGIPILFTADVVTICMVTGKLISFANSGISIPTDLPDASSVVSLDKATDEYAKNTDLHMAYIWPEWRGQKAPAPVLVYRTADNDEGMMYIDALTGKAARSGPVSS